MFLPELEICRKLLGGPAAWCLAAGFLFLAAGPARAGEPVPVSVRHEVRVAYQANDDSWEKGIASSLYKIKAQIGFYEQMGVDRSALDLHAVFHGDAGYFLLRDEPYNARKRTTGGNPNQGIVSELTRAGVVIALCAQTMKQNGWAEEDILPEVVIVNDAYSRLADLQLQGFAYLEF